MQTSDSNRTCPARPADGPGEPAHRASAPDASGIAVNLISFGPAAGFEDMLSACSARGIRFVSPWTRQFADIGTQAAIARMAAHGLSVNGLCRLADFGPAGTAKAFDAALADAYAILELAARMGARFVAVTGGGLPAGSSDLDAARDRIARAMRELAPAAQRLRVGLALEPLHPMFAPEHGAVSTMRQALSICDAAGDGAGVLVDTYHVWWDPEVGSMIDAAGSRILGFQVSDWTVPTVRTTHARGMPGEGVIDNAGLLRRARSAGFSGPVEHEIFAAETWWRRDPGAVLDGILLSAL